MFADDMVILPDSTYASEILTAMEEEMKGYGMKISIRENKLMEVKNKENLEVR